MGPPGTGQRTPVAPARRDSGIGERGERAPRARAWSGDSGDPAQAAACGTPGAAWLRRWSGGWRDHGAGHCRLCGELRVGRERKTRGREMPDSTVQPLAGAWLRRSVARCTAVSQPSWKRTERRRGIPTSSSGGRRRGGGGGGGAWASTRSAAADGSGETAGRESAGGDWRGLRAVGRGPRGAPRPRQRRPRSTCVSTTECSSDPAPTGSRPAGAAARSTPPRQPSRPAWPLGLPFFLSFFFPGSFSRSSLFSSSFLFLPPPFACRVLRVDLSFLFLRLLGLPLVAYSSSFSVSILFLDAFFRISPAGCIHLSLCICTGAKNNKLQEGHKRQLLLFVRGHPLT